MDFILWIVVIISLFYLFLKSCFSIMTISSFEDDRVSPITVCENLNRHVKHDLLAALLPFVLNIVSKSKSPIVGGLLLLLIVYQLFLIATHQFYYNPNKLCRDINKHKLRIAAYIAISSLTMIMAVYCLLCSIFK